MFADSFPVGLGYVDEATYGIAKRLVTLLKKAVTMDPRLVPQIDDLESRGHGGIRSFEQLAERDEVVFAGTKLPATYLSHGYQATLAWLADLIGQFLLDLPEATLSKIELQDLSGLVLVDELDLFLHPDWQSGFVEARGRRTPSAAEGADGSRDQGAARSATPIMIRIERGSEPPALAAERSRRLARAVQLWLARGRPIWSEAPDLHQDFRGEIERTLKHGYAVVRDDLIRAQHALCAYLWPAAALPQALRDHDPLDALVLALRALPPSRPGRDQKDAVLMAYAESGGGEIAALESWTPQVTTWREDAGRLDAAGRLAFDGQHIAPR